ncbi:hypothetical protein [Dankookia sp. P2]|uniref:hypothetical protein n=1 Tax=Dankookia sp. P2 TaxID=3423955 RepID=UPI003D6795B1
MAETSGDKVPIATALGTIEAHRMGRTEAGQSRWQVRYPWGIETFFGTSAEVSEHVGRRATESARRASGDAERRRKDRSPDP